MSTFVGTYALPYDVHVDKGSVSSGTIAGMTLDPLVIGSADGEVDCYFSVWFRDAYEARYLQLLVTPFWPIVGGGIRCYWQVMAWNFVRSRWDQTPAMMGDVFLRAGTTTGDRRRCPIRSATPLDGPYVQVGANLWLLNPEATTTGEPFLQASLTQTITSEHIDSQGRAAIRLKAWPSAQFDAEYQVSIRAVFGCRSNFPLPRTYSLLLGDGFKTEYYQQTYTLTWDPDEWLTRFGVWKYQLPDDGGEIKFSWRWSGRHFMLGTTEYDLLESWGGSATADIDNADALEPEAVASLLLGYSYSSGNPGHPVAYTGAEVYAMKLFRDMTTTDTIRNISGASLVGYDYTLWSEGDVGRRTMTLTAGSV